MGRTYRVADRARYAPRMLRSPTPLLAKPFLYGECRERGDLGD
jgi:hypothetical protein